MEWVNAVLPRFLWSANEDGTRKRKIYDLTAPWESVATTTLTVDFSAIESWA